MELNKKKLLTVLSEIKAYKDVVVFQDSAEDGYLDILYAPYKGIAEAPGAIHKITMSLKGSDADLFDDSPVPEKLGEAVPIYLTRIRDTLKDARTCIFKDGCVNGIRVAFDKSDIYHYSTVEFILARHEVFSNKIKAVASVSFKKIDWAYVISECSKFISNDIDRYNMAGICFDFFLGGKDFVHIVATDGRKAILLKQACNHEMFKKEDDGQFIVPPAYLFVPDSNYSSAQIRLSKTVGQLLITTEDYSFEGIFDCIEAKFPTYTRVLPEVTDKTQWFTLSASSLRRTINSVKSLMGKGRIFLDAENPESLTITLEESATILEVEGTASRPMCVSFFWEHLSPCLFDGMALTKFNLDGANCAVTSHSNKAVRGLSLDVTKIFMPARFDNIASEKLDEFNICVSKDKKVDSSSSSNGDDNA